MDPLQPTATIADGPLDFPTCPGPSLADRFPDLVATLGGPWHLDGEPGRYLVTRAGRPPVVLDRRRDLAEAVVVTQALNRAAP